MYSISPKKPIKNLDYCTKDMRFYSEGCEKHSKNEEKHGKSRDFYIVFLEISDFCTLLDYRRENLKKGEP